MFDALRLIEKLQDAAQRGYRERLESVVGDRMIWVMRVKHNARGLDLEVIYGLRLTDGLRHGQPN